LQSRYDFICGQSR